MKKLLFIISLCFFVVIQTNSQTNTFPTSGNVGVGITTPIYELNIHDSGSGSIDSRIQLTNYDTGTAWTDGFQMIMNGSSANYKVNLLNRENSDMGFWTNNTERVTISNNGSVGIGTSTPSTLLELKSIGRSELTLSGDGTSAINAGVILIANNSSNQRGLGVFMQDNGAANEWFIGRPYSGSDKFVINRRNNTVNHTSITSSLNHNTPTEITKNLFTVLNDGNVGIGTTTPDAKLAVKGNIHTNEVKVDLLGAVAPDYVFYKDYDLKTLNEVENYIAKEGHLPNIPSAKEMETNGLLLKEMNLKLLEKIEELMLYTIQQEKEIKTSKNEITILKKKASKVEVFEERLQKIEALLNFLKH